MFGMLKMYKNILANCDGKSTIALQVAKKIKPCDTAFRK